MQELELIWRTALSAGLFSGYVYGCAWVGWQCGVSADDDCSKKIGKAGSGGDVVRPVVFDRGPRNTPHDVGAMDMRDNDKIIDLTARRDSLALHRWARAFYRDHPSYVRTRT